MPKDIEIGQYLLITGNPVDGFVFMGPFRSHSKASIYAERHCSHHTEWWIGEMIMPNQSEGNLP
jgi:hypothetical protein